MAAWPWVGFGISTKPKPRERPVILSWMTAADETSPCAWNVCFRSSAVASYDRFPTKMFTTAPDEKERIEKSKLGGFSFRVLGRVDVAGSRKWTLPNGRT